MKTDPQLAAETGREYNRKFANADKNGDLLLNQDEFAAYFQMAFEDSKARFGDSMSFSEEDMANHYAAYNSVTPEVEGVSEKDVARSYFLRTALQAEINSS